jgi:hypothetical protein
MRRRRRRQQQRVINVEIQDIPTPLFTLPREIHHHIIGDTDYPSTITLLFTCKRMAAIVKSFVDAKKTPDVLLSWRSEMPIDAAYAGYLNILKWMKESFDNIIIGNVAFISAAKGEHLEIMKWIDDGDDVDKKFIDSRPLYVYVKAAKCGNLEIVKSLVNEWHCPLIADLFNAVIKSQNMETLKWLIEMGCDIDETTFEVAVETGNLEMVIWFKDMGCTMQWNNIFSSAIRGGNIELLKWLKEQGCMWDEDTIASAICLGDLHILTWLKENGCPWHWNSYGLALSIITTKPHVIEWLKENDCPINIVDAYNAAVYGNLEFMKWVVNVKGCKKGVFTSSLFMNAVSGGNVEMLEWLHENECPMCDEVVDIAVMNGNVKIANWLKEVKGCQFTKNAYVTALVNKGDIDMLKWLYDCHDEEK